MIRNYVRRLLWLALGMLVSAIGIVMMLQANIGLEPWSVLQQGMAQSFGITYGTASVIVGARGKAQLIGNLSPVSIQIGRAGNVQPAFI